MHKGVRGNACKDMVALESRVCEQIEGIETHETHQGKETDWTDLNEPDLRRAEHSKVS